MDTSSSHDQIAKKLQDMGAMLEMQARKLHDDGNEGGALSRDQQELHDAYRPSRPGLKTAFVISPPSIAKSTGWKSG